MGTGDKMGFGGESTFSVIASAGAGALLAFIGMTILRRQTARRKNFDGKSPWRGKAKFYHTPSFRSSRCAWLIEELGVQMHFEIQPYNEFAAEPEEIQWYKENVHPHGYVPALVIEGKTMVDSGAICLYLAETFNELLPDLRDQTHYYSWAIYAVATLDRVTNTLYRQLQKTPEDKQDPRLVADMLEQYAEFARSFNAYLEGRDFICGKKFTVADIMIGYNIMEASMIKGGLLLTDYDNIKAYLARLKARKTFSAGMGTPRDWLNLPQWEATNELIEEE